MTAAQTTQAPNASARRAPTRRVGVVTSAAREKSRTVAVDFQSRHPKYGKYITRQVKYHVHDPENATKLGDRVEIARCRPISKTKAWRLVKIIEAAPEPVAHKTGEELLEKEPEAQEQETATPESEEETQD